MKYKRMNVGLSLAGVLVGLTIGPVAHAVNEYLTVTLTTQTFYVDGQQVELEAMPSTATTM